MKKKAALLTIWLSAAPAFAGVAGDALPFLKIDAGARGAAMAGAYCAAGDDALSVFYNPAGTALADKKQVLLGHNEWLTEIRNETLAYVHPLGPRLTAFGGANILLSGSMAKREAINGDVTGSFSVFEGAASAGLSWEMGEGWYGGAALKALTQQADGESAMAWAGDAGLLKVSGAWKAGASAANFGSRLKLGDSAFRLPLMLRAGAAYTFLRNYSLAAEAVKPGSSDAAAALGAEARVNAGPREYFFLRAGYTTGRSLHAGSGVTGGLGLASQDLRVDYAFAPYGDLGDAHRVTLSFSFGRSRPEDLRRRPYAAPAPARRVKRAPPQPAAAEKRSGKRTAPAPKKPVKKKKESRKEDVYFMW